MLQTDDRRQTDVQRHIANR